MEKTTFFDYVKMHDEALKKQGIGVFDSQIILEYYQGEASVPKVYEIDEESYDYLLGVMPPLKRNNAYMLPELIIGNVGYQFKQKDGHYYIWLGFSK